MNQRMNFRIKRVRFSKSKVVGTTAFFLLFLALVFFFRPSTLNSASLTTASATLSNPRISFSGAVSVGASAGANAINIKTSGDYADESTSHLFPKDTISVGEEGALTVASVVDSDTFILSAGLTIPASDDDAIYATQSGTLTVTFTTANAIPANGNILLTIADPATNGNDGAPDTADSITNNGFDFNGIGTDNITCPTGANWSVTSATAGVGAGHTVICTTNTEVAASTSLTVVIGDETVPLVNPAPVYSGHTQGLADIYEINIKTRDSGDLTIDEVDTKAAAVEAVLVSATVDESLTFQVQAVNSGSTVCGQIADVTTTPTSVPWGLLSTSDVFKEAAQRLTVSTNADGGYTVKIEENDQMGKNGGACAGNGGEGVNCIQDTTCSLSGCDETDGYDWTDAATFRGLGYSLEDVDGSDATFVYNSDDPCSDSAGGGSFCAKQIADVAALETKTTIMTNSNPVSSKDIYVCYRIAISGTQPAGYYYNKVKYTATAIF
jgi:hypothetical protein